MGKGALLVAFAGIFAGMITLLNVEQMAQSTNKRQADYQADVIARQIARSTHEEALGAIVGKGCAGLSRTTERSGGWAQVTCSKDEDEKKYTVMAEGRFGGPSSDQGKNAGAAVHRIRSTYQFVGMQLPASIILDNTRSIMEAIQEGKNGNQAKINWEQAAHAIMADLIDSGSPWADLLDPETLADDLEEQLGNIDLGEGGEGDPGVFTSELKEKMEEFYEEKRVEGSPMVEDFYQSTIDKVEANEDEDYVTNHDGDYTLSSGDDASFGSASAPAVVRVKGDLTVEQGAELSGQGVLLVEGDLTISDKERGEPQGGKLDWKGLVLVVPPSGTVEDGEVKNTGADAILDGQSSVDGALMTRHEVLAPGGHLDVTVWAANRYNWQWRQPFGERQPTGSWGRSYSLGCGWMPGCSPRSGYNYAPFWMHTHKYDEVTGSRRMPFIKNGGRPWNPFRGRLRLDHILDELDSDKEVYLQFKNTNRSGRAWYDLEIDRSGKPDVNRNSFPVRSGFAEDHETFVSPSFKPDDLETFDVQVRTLRGMLQAFDDAHRDCYRGAWYGECEGYSEGDVISWPVWIGNDEANREGAFTIQLRLASSGAKIYEASAYWHKNKSEEEEDNEEEEALKEELAENPDEFGMNVRLGKHSKVNYDREKMLDVVRLLGMKAGANPYRHISTNEEHWSPNERNSATPHPYEKRG